MCLKPLPRNSQEMRKIYPSLLLLAPTFHKVCIKTHRNLGAFPLTLKLRTLKLKIENTPNENTPIISQKVLMLTRGGIILDHSKMAYFAKLQWNFFFCIYKLYDKHKKLRHMVVYLWTTKHLF